MKRRIARGFTLIELLVVIAIIAILAAILFPVFAQARESARTSSCLSNMKQIMLGMLMYSQDYDEKFPGSRIIRLPGNVDGDPVNGKIIGFRTVTQPYIKNKQIWRCPSNPNDDVATEEADKEFKSSYASNGVLIYDTSGPKHSNIDRPAEIEMFHESLWANNDLGDWVARINNPPACAWGTGFYQHRGKIQGDGTKVTTPNGGLGNWAFFDGHTKAKSMPSMFIPQGTGSDQYNGFGRCPSCPGGQGELDNDKASNLCKLYQ